MEVNEVEYQKFVKYCQRDEKFTGFTLSQVEFGRQIFEFMEDYPSFRKMLTTIGDKQGVFEKIQQFLKENQK